MPWGQIAGAVIGGVMANKAAKKAAGAQRYAADKSAQGYDDARPYITQMYQEGRDYLNDALDQGAYTGQTYAGLNPTQMQGVEYLRNFGQGLMPAASNFMDTAGGFANNALSIFNRASQPSLDNAVAYATSSPQAQGLIDAAMRDSTRQLNEQVLPTINAQASQSGNTNSSRAGIASALAQRAYDDRRADVAQGVFDDLTNRYLSSNTQDLRNMANANQSLQNIYGIGASMGEKIGGILGRAGGVLQADQQGQLDDNRSAFERARDFGLEQVMKFNAGILNNAPQSASRQPNFFNPQMAALSGAMQGFGFGGTIADAFKNNNPQPTARPLPDTMATGSYSMGFGNKPYGF